MSDQPYDSTDDTLAHIALVRGLIRSVIDRLIQRAAVHDASKLQEPEKSGFDIIRPRLDSDDIDSDEYRATLREFSETLDIHYWHNRHHPEHHAMDSMGVLDETAVKDGTAIASMTLWDITEMLCDWAAASQRKPGGTVNLDWAVKRFGISDQLASILANTVKEMGW